MTLCLRRRLSSKTEFINWLSETVGGEENIGGKKRIEILGMAIISRMETLKQIYTEDLIRSEERYLIDFNYTVEKVISSSTFN